MNRKMYILLTLVPSVYFLLLGVFDIGMDAFYGTLDWYRLLSNVPFFLPLLFRKAGAHLFMGILLTMLWGYLLVVGGVMLSSGSNPAQLKQLEIVGAAIFLLFSFACSVSLMMGGVLRLNDKFHPRQQVAG